LLPSCSRTERTLSENGAQIFFPLTNAFGILIQKTLYQNYPYLSTKRAKLSIRHFTRKYFYFFVDKNETQKSGESPLMVARLSKFYLYLNNANGEAVFEQFPIV